MRGGEGGQERVPFFFVLGRECNRCFGRGIAIGVVLIEDTEGIAFASQSEEGGQECVPFVVVVNDAAMDFPIDNVVDSASGGGFDVGGGYRFNRVFFLAADRGYRNHGEQGRGDKVLFNHVVIFLSD